MPDEQQEAQQFTCERCGYKYMRINDRRPFLCLRCIRYIAKSTFMAVTEDRYTRPVDGQSNSPAAKEAIVADNH